MNRKVRSLALATVLPVVVASIGATISTPAQAAGGHRGTLKVTIKAPKGVPASVVITGRARLTTGKAPGGTKHVDVLRTKTGSYRIAPRPITYHGKVYRGAASRSAVKVRGGKTTKVVVVYHRLKLADGLTASKVTTSSVSLVWHHAPKKSTLRLRRTTGTSAATRHGQGKAVKIKGSSAKDKGLKAGTTYSYALFTKGKHGWSPSVQLTVGTASGNAADAAYTTPPSSLVVPPGSKVMATPTGVGVSVVLPKGMAAPVLGGGVALPQSASLPGGYLGVVQDVSPDGHTVTLSPGGLADVFDYYDVDAELAALGKIRLAPITSPARAAAALAQAQQAQTRRGDRRNPGPLAAGLSSCLEGGYSQEITLRPVLSPHGHFKAHLKTKWGIPTGATFDVRAELETGMKYDASVNGSVACALPLEPVMRTFVTSPVPIAINLSPIASISINGSIQTTDSGVTVTGGFWTKGKVGLHNSIDGGLINQVNAPDTKTEGNVSIDASLGGQVIIGPGAGTAEAGVIAGVSGTAIPVKLSMSSAYPVGDVRYGKCLRLGAGAEYSLGVTAKAWLGKFSASKTFTPSFLKAQPSYGTWFLPSGCDTLPSPDNTLLGPGLTLQHSSTTGDPSQWGHLPGFAPNESAWVLSTGLISSAVGSPDDFASTDVGGAGNATLDALAGDTTYDAASYVIDAIPTGSTLHVRFAFASEEYPEFVNAGYNDVMGVFVNGQNCALVPGTSLPVSVDNVNDHTNAQYYIDNSVGASGYQTSMDGLTVPITCNAAVVPGQPVHVEIAVADVGDHVYDSAVALLDGGIWAD